MGGLLSRKILLFLTPSLETSYRIVRVQNWIVFSRNLDADRPRYGFTKPPSEVVTSLNGRHSARFRADGSLVAADLRGSIRQVGAALEGAPSCNGWDLLALPARRDAGADRLLPPAAPCRDQRVAHLAADPSGVGVRNFLPQGALSLFLPSLNSGPSSLLPGPFFLVWRPPRRLAGRKAPASTPCA